MGRGGQLPRHRQARRREWRADPPGAAEGLGIQRTGAAAKVLSTLEKIQKDFNGAHPAARRCRWPT
jgi:hypothetical protein